MGKSRDWVFSLVVGALCVALAFVPDAVQSDFGSLPRVRAKVVSVDNSELYPLDMMYDRGLPPVGELFIPRRKCDLQTLRHPRAFDKKAENEMVF